MEKSKVMARTVEAVGCGATKGVIWPVRERRKWGSSSVGEEEALGKRAEAAQVVHSEGDEGNVMGMEVRDDILTELGTGTCMVFSIG